MTDEFEEWVAWGVVGRPHGVRGEMRAFPGGDDSPFEISAGTTIRLVLADSVRRFTVESFRGAGKFRLLHLEGVDGREEASAWTHAKLELPRDLREELDHADEFYADELIDAAVIDESGRSLGSVREVANYGAGDILIYGEGRDRRMVPFADPYIVEVRRGAGNDTTNELVMVIRPDWIDD